MWSSDALVWARWSTIAAMCLSCLAAAPASETSMPTVPKADLSTLKPSDFRDDELDVPFYLAHFHRLANSIEQAGPNRGFITLPVWRPKRHNRPYNARVLENYVVLAYFYCTDRPWNPYYKRSAVRQRLEAVLDFWCRAQNKDGWFSEYRPQGWNLPATGFATMFMGETLRLLHDGPPIDEALHRRVIAAHAKAIRALLTSQPLFDAGKRCSNQYSALWGGALAHLDLYPSAEVAALLRKRLADSLREHQSPVGYWYEKSGCDWRYTLRTHAGNILMAWHYARGTELAELFVQGESRYAEWRSYNALREPNGSYVLNRAIDSRTRGDFTARHCPLAEKVVLARAFMPTQSEAKEAIARNRRQLAKDWPNVPPLRVGDHHAFSPHVILNLHHHRWCPTQAQRAEAIAKLPYLLRKRFTHQRSDSRLPQVYTFVRRPAYYAVFNAGKQLDKQQRYGLGMIWRDRAGTLLASQSGSHDAAWGTRAAGAKDVYETELIGPSCLVGGQAAVPKAGARDLPKGDLVMAYPLGKGGQKRVTFADDHIAVEVRHEGAFAEQLPLLLARGFDLELGEGAARLTGETEGVEIRFDPTVKADTLRLDTMVAGKRIIVLRLQGQGHMCYQVRFP